MVWQKVDKYKVILQQLEQLSEMLFFFPYQVRLVFEYEELTLIKQQKTALLIFLLSPFIQLESVNYL